MQVLARRPPVLAAIRLVGLAAAAALVLAGVTGCSGEASNEPAQRASAEPTALQAQTRIARVTGRLPVARRQVVERRVGTLVQRYVEAAFVEGRSGRSAFPGFTGGARRLAVGDERVLALGSSPTRVARASAYVSVFAAGGRARGATARLVLRLAGSGGARPTSVTGRLLLTPTRPGWRIFGYDVARGGPGVDIGGERP